RTCPVQKNRSAFTPEADMCSALAESALGQKRTLARKRQHFSVTRSETSVSFPNAAQSLLSEDLFLHSFRIVADLCDCGLDFVFGSTKVLAPMSRQFLAGYIDAISDSLGTRRNSHVLNRTIKMRNKLPFALCFP